MTTGNRDGSGSEGNLLPDSMLQFKQIGKCEQLREEQEVSQSPTEQSQSFLGHGSVVSIKKDKESLISPTL